MGGRGSGGGGGGKGKGAGGGGVGSLSQSDIEERIQAAYNAAPKSNTGWATLEDIRAQLGNSIPREQLDRALVQFANRENVHLIPESNQKSLTPAQWSAAVHIGGQPKHLLLVEKPR